MTRPQDPDETIPALTYKRALVPVLKTLLEMLEADALFLWELFDVKEQAAESNYQEMSEEEKEDLCLAFYKFLVDKQKSIIDQILPAYPPTKSDANSTPERGPERMKRFLKGRYSILKFTEGVTNENRFRPLKFGFGEEARPRKYVVLYSEVADELTEVEPSPQPNPFGEEPTKDPFGKKIAKPLKMEGVTAFHARTNTSGEYSKEDLGSTYQKISIGLNYDRITLDRNTGGPPIDRCEYLRVFPVRKGGKVIGVLKAEYYPVDKPLDSARVDKVGKPLDSAGVDKKVERCLDFLAEFIIKSREGVDALTYARLCKGSNLTKRLREAKDAAEQRASKNLDSAVKTILSASIHLFDVFNRRTYIGWEEISDRINHYADEMCDVLALPKLNILGRFKELGRYDELLLSDIPQYREHFIHQFHAFILGLLVILEIGIDEFAGWANDQLETRSRVFHKHPNKIDARSVIRIWFLACFFHDYAYILQQFDNVMGSFIKKILGLDRLIIDNDWSQLFTEKPIEDRASKRTQFSGYLLDMATYFVSGEQKLSDVGITTHPKLLVDEMWNSVIIRQDHGPLSALVLLDSVLGTGKADRDRVNEAYMAALAVACHHKEVFRQVASVGGESFLTLEGFPFIFLLVYCDTAQEWGRKKREENGIEYDSPVLESVEVKKMTPHTEVKTTLCYDSLGDPDRIPEKPFISRIEAETACSFKSRNYSFVISYVEKPGDNPDAHAIQIADIRFPIVGPCE